MFNETRDQLRERKIHYSKCLRKQMTEAAQALWEELRGRKPAHLKFRRQVPIDIYIVDFLCFRKRLVIEVDGGIHQQQKEYDQAREAVLQRNGFRVVRFTNEDVLFDTQNVLRKICDIALRL